MLPTIIVEDYYTQITDKYSIDKNNVIISIPFYINPGRIIGKHGISINYLTTMFNTTICVSSCIINNEIKFFIKFRKNKNFDEVINYFKYYFSDKRNWSLYIDIPIKNNKSVVKVTGKQIEKWESIFDCKIYCKYYKKDYNKLIINNLSAHTYTSIIEIKRYFENLFHMYSNSYNNI